MASSASTITNNAEPTAPLILVNLSNCITLTSLTYLPSASQLQSLLYGFDLLKFIDGRHPTPPENTTKDGTTTPNPAHITWHRQDCLLRGSLLGTLVPSISPLVLQTKTSKELWDTLKTTYANPSRGNILQVKDNLDSLTKATLIIGEYIHAIKTCTDKLAILGKLMDAEDIISKTLKGFDYETYKPVIDTVRARDTPISFEALHEKLIHHELSLKQNSLPANLHASAHLATNRNFHPKNNNRRPTTQPPHCSLPT